MNVAAEASAAALTGQRRPILHRVRRIENIIVGIGFDNLAEMSPRRRP